MNSTAIDVAARTIALPERNLVGSTRRPVIEVPRLAGRSSSLRRALSFAGPGYMVAVGYMDPGNWATSLSAGSTFGYSLLSVILLSNVMATLLQAAAVRLGVASGLDLAQSCRQHLSPRLNFILWLGCEIAVVACNLAEVLGMACGLGLLFHIPLPIGVCITAVDVFLVLGLQRRGVRPFEALIIALVALIGACFAVQLWWLHPPLAAVAAGFVPTTQILSSPQMLYLAVGIIGATVMPHNLYLHSSIVQTRLHDRCEKGIRQAIRYATLDSNIALCFALFVNAGILILAAGAFHRPGQGPIASLEEAYRLLSPLLGISAAGTVFGIALIASGLSSSITGTLAGQIVMEGFLDIPVSRVKRAFLTRCLAILPAVVIAASLGSAGVGRLLVFSQVILGLQLPFAVVPLLWFTTRRKHLGVHAFGLRTSVVLWSIAVALVMINSWVIYEML
jgi:manganese transport protein